MVLWLYTATTPHIYIFFRVHGLCARVVRVALSGPVSHDEPRVSATLVELRITVQLESLKEVGK